MVVDDCLRTSDPDTFAIGEVALHRNMIYGLVAPGYEMADVVAANLLGAGRTFTGFDMSTKLKLMGVDVASFGDPFTTLDGSRALTFEDPFAGVYKKLVFNSDGTKLVGGVLVGDASDYGNLLRCYKSGEPLNMTPGELLRGRSEANDDKSDTQVCSFNNVGERTIRTSIRDGKLSTIAEVKSCTLAGTGCGGCVPRHRASPRGNEGSGCGSRASPLRTLAYCRQELFQIIKIKEVRSFADLIVNHGAGSGCRDLQAGGRIDTREPLERARSRRGARDTSRHQRSFPREHRRSGDYSVVPRVPGGEITPEKLISIGTVRKNRPLHQDHGRPAYRPIQSHGAPTAGYLGGTDRGRDSGESGHAYGKASEP